MIWQPHLAKALLAQNEQSYLRGTEYHCNNKGFLSMLCSVPEVALPSAKDTACMNCMKHGADLILQPLATNNDHHFCQVWESSNLLMSTRVWGASKQQRHPHIP